MGSSIPASFLCLDHGPGWEEVGNWDLGWIYLGWSLLSEPWKAGFSAVLEPVEVAHSSLLEVSTPTPASMRMTWRSSPCKAAHTPLHLRICPHIHSLSDQPLGPSQSITWLGKCWAWWRKKGTICWRIRSKHTTAEAGNVCMGLDPESARSRGKGL